MSDRPELQDVLHAALCACGSLDEHDDQVEPDEAQPIRADFLRAVEKIRERYGAVLAVGGPLDNPIGETDWRVEPGECWCLRKTCPGCALPGLPAITSVDRGCATWHLSDGTIHADRATGLVFMAIGPSVGAEYARQVALTLKAAALWVETA
jgi:hypothetical protein